MYFGFIFALTSWPQHKWMNIYIKIRDGIGVIVSDSNQSDPSI